MMGWDYVSELRPPTGLLFIPRIIREHGEPWWWSCQDKFWLVHQSSLAVLQAETYWASRRNGRRSENFAYQYLKYLKGSLTCRKILTTWDLRLYFPSEGRWFLSKQFRSINISCSLSSHLYSQIYFVISSQTLEVNDIFISSLQSLVVYSLICFVIFLPPLEVTDIYVSSPCITDPFRSISKHLKSPTSS
jgi:hypothetical protein